AERSCCELHASSASAAFCLHVGTCPLPNGCSSRAGWSFSGGTPFPLSPSPLLPGVCTLPADGGLCFMLEERWYFDHEEKKCQPFSWGGCGGNENNFGSRPECESACSPYGKPRIDPRAEGLLSRAPCFCFESKRRFFYNGTSKACEPFTYTGCPWNHNRFYTLEECQRTCRHVGKRWRGARGAEDGVPYPAPAFIVPPLPSPPLVSDICRLPLKPGPCDKKEKRWFFDSGVKRCKRFFYGGCYGNQNNFQTLKECRQKFQPGPPLGLVLMPPQFLLSRTFQSPTVTDPQILPGKPNDFPPEGTDQAQLHLFRCMNS
uniref:BPTI/Kunitz inhibitor domain-containing protein n=1 Tax=Varanus komodoensis TaxID=61221 RepID=A0A8D2KZ22_VARKO